MMPTLRCVNVRKIFGTAVAVDGVDFEVMPGELFALLGPSGCGKTTTLRMVAGLVAPSAGGIYLQERLVNAVPAHRRGAAMVFQSYALFPHMTVSENVAFGLDVRGTPKAEIGPRVVHALDMVRLRHLQDRYPRQLSGGEQQRVALARAAAVDPVILLLDEPLGALDRRLRDEMQVELRQLQRQLEVATILVTHDQDEALTLADRIAVMNHGRIVQLGRPAEVYERPADSFVSSFLGVSNLLRGDVVESGPGTVTVKTRGGAVVRAATDRQWVLGREVVLALRPERINLGGTSGGWNGVVEHVSYLGKSYRLHVRLNDADRMIVFEQNRSDTQASPCNGHTVRLSWDPADVRVLEG
jgi:spermidine/putrescine ABC transporter ATP-binding subunit